MSDLKGLALALRMIEQLNSGMPIRQVRCLIELAQETEPLRQTELAKRIGLSLSATSRYIQAFGPEGLGLVNNDPHPTDVRCKLVSLTSEGRRVIAEITRQLEAA